MLDDYALQVATPAQSSAVAELMFACGVAVDMQYTSIESGAQVLDVPVAMVKYFDYDKGNTLSFSDDYYGLYDWEDLIYDQLVEFGPAQYSGQSNEEDILLGVTVIVSDDIPLQLGLGRNERRIFSPDSLDPEEQGIGGSMSGFNYDQSIIANVSLPAGSETVVL